MRCTSPDTSNKVQGVKERGRESTCRWASHNVICVTELQHAGELEQAVLLAAHDDSVLHSAALAHCVPVTGSSGKTN